ncbi:TPA: hypothetical protein IAA87_07570 [Candidatus Avigastranaerophilus faecigallinarum]|nr:hypothetical protein [Candidatus Avigastranaerophilus faecigallinarum]
MKEIEISSTTFNMIVNTLKNFRITDDSRPILKQIYCQVEKNRITFTAVNGFIASRIKLNYTNEEIEPFDFTFYPFKIDEDKRGLNKIKIKYTNDYITFTYKDSENNEMIKKIANLKQQFINIDNLFNEEERTKITFDNNLLLKTLTSLRNTKNKVVSIEFTNNPTKPILIKNDILEQGKVECIVLPIRTLR